MPRLALLQSRAFATKAESFDHHESLIRQAAAAARTSSSPRSCSSRPISAPSRTPPASTSPTRCPARSPTASAARRRTRRRPDFLALRAPRPRPLSQHRRHPRRRRLAAGPLPENPHPAGPRLRGEILLHPRRQRLAGLEHPLRQNRRAHLLGPMVSGSRPPDGPRRRAGPGLSDRHRLAAEEKPTLGDAQHCAWETVQRGHAVANGCYLAAVNRTGPEGDTEFWGRSSSPIPTAKSSPRPPPTTRKSSSRPRPAAIEDFRRIWPFFRDRRIDAYGDLTKRWRS